MLLSALRKTLPCLSQNDLWLAHGFEQRMDVSGARLGGNPAAAQRHLPLEFRAIANYVNGAHLAGTNRYQHLRTNQIGFIPVAITVQEIADILQISKTKAYDLCKNPEFRIIRLGRTIRVSKASFDEWLNNLL